MAFNLNRLSYKKPMSEAVTSLADSFRTTDNSEHSYFVEACKFAEEMDNMMVEMNRSFYGSICESQGSTVLIHEGFSDWVDTFKKLLKKVIDFLHALLNKFWVGLNMLIKREAFIKDHKKDFIKFNDNHKFHMNIFTFTFDNNIPEETAIYSSLDLNSLDAIKDKNLYKDFKDSFNTGDGNANYETKSGGISAKTDNIGAIEKSSEELYKNLKDELDNDTYYDLVRGRFLGKPETRVDSVDYSKDLFEVFRDGQSGKEDHEFEYSDIQDALARFENYERIKKDLTKKKNAAEKEYKAVEKELDGLVKKGKDKKITIKGINGDKEFVVGSDVAINKYDLYIKTLSTMVHEVSNLHTIAFSARLDAYKDCFKQDKTILYKALYRILGNIKTGERKYSTPKESD